MGSSFVGSPLFALVLDYVITPAVLVAVFVLIRTIERAWRRYKQD